ncbi:hypothetical protein FE783_05880 [Paenibacillus mesophilus]|uniref:YphA family membrane protein n=1 Tax=Paenibacillus mesophilus TaxID=2582849 RepID=UPI00110E5D07|nr:hypothetical protein [Paenibacillus mesophilus]TMV51311.1 hypothetical protein FE783_05880 [Paenibacillus mesophilus]
MNPGFLTFILISITLILLASGWKSMLLPGIPHYAIVIFFTAWCLSGLFHFRLRDGIEINGTVVVLFAVAMPILLDRRSIVTGLHYVSLSLFLASVYYLLKHLGDLDPFLLPYRSWAGTAWIAAMLAAVLIRKAKDQIACLSLALLCGSALYRLVHPDRTAVPFGGLQFQDEWWLTVFAARMIAVAGENAAASVRYASKSIMDRWRGLRK